MDLVVLSSDGISLGSEHNALINTLSFGGVTISERMIDDLSCCWYGVGVDLSIFRGIENCSLGGGGIDWFY